jgi:hypothetical protein
MNGAGEEERGSPNVAEFEHLAQWLISATKLVFRTG